MGLDTTHDCWHGSYSAFHRWRCGIAKAAGIPLDLMEGYWINLGMPKGSSSQRLPLKWESLKPDILHVLLDHSDSEGEIAAKHCGPLADRLEELLPLLPEGSGGGHIGDWREKTQRFIDGLRLAASQGEPVGFH